MLVRKKQKWKWKQEQEETFRKLKEVFTIEFVLVIPNINKEMGVETDASNYVTEGVLLTKCITNFIWPYLYQFFDDSHGLKGYKKPLKRPFDWY